MDTSLTNPDFIGGFVFWHKAKTMNLTIKCKGLSLVVHEITNVGTAIVKVAFLFGIFGMDFTSGKAILAIIVAVFSSVAMSGIPGGGGTGELVLCTVFFPEQMAIAYPIAIALGNLVDPPATMVNAAGDYVVSFIVSRFVDGKDWLQKKLHKD